jgi:hypothetical protein
MRLGLEAYEATRAKLGLSWITKNLADQLARGGRAEEGLTEVAQGLVLVARTGERVHEPELLRLRGELLRLRAAHADLEAGAASTGEAESCFRQAIDIARRQTAKWYELRAVTSLSRLLRDQGRKEEAHQMLADVYDWFTEGFDLADLQEAKTLIAELS